jgi:hypothetical protein
MATVPLTLTIVWHPRDPEGKVAAETLAQWFEPMTGGLLSGLRIPVRVRSQSATGTPNDPPTPIALDEADVNLVLIVGTRRLIDAADKDWKDFFDRLIADCKGRKERDHIMIAALEPDALALPQAPDLQADRTYEWDQDLFLQADGGYKAGPGLTQLAIIVADNFAYRLLLRQEQEKNSAVSNASWTPPRQKLFLSHTKHDQYGLALAKELFRLLQQNRYGLGVFFDAYDLRSGVNFWLQLTNAIDGSAFLAIATDKYAARPVCQFEILEAKRLRCPVLMAHLVEKGEDRAFPYAGNVPVRIMSKSPSRSEIELLLLDLCLENLRGLSFRREAEPKRQNLETAAKTVDVISRKPELSDIVHLRAKVPPPSLVLYPDPPLANHEFGALTALAGGIDFKALSEA